MNDSKVFTQLIYHRIYSDARAKLGWYGESHFEPVKVEQSRVKAVPSAPRVYLSKDEPATKYFFYSFEPGWTSDQQPAPMRQFMVLLSGTMEVETSDGEIKQFKPGNIILMVDTWGKGHKARNIGKEYLHVFAVQIPIK